MEIIEKCKIGKKIYVLTKTHIGFTIYLEMNTIHQLYDNIK